MYVFRCDCVCLVCSSENLFVHMIINMYVIIVIICVFVALCATATQEGSSSEQ